MFKTRPLFWFGLALCAFSGSAYFSWAGGFGMAALWVAFWFTNQTIRHRRGES